MFDFGARAVVLVVTAADVGVGGNNWCKGVYIDRRVSSARHSEK